MKNFNSISYLNILWFAGMALLGVSLVFTLATGESPLEAMGISPKAGTLGTLGVMIALAFGPSLIRKFFTKPANQ